jgi:hypothetical protein
MVSPIKFLAEDPEALTFSVTLLKIPPTKNHSSTADMARKPRKKPSSLPTEASSQPRPTNTAVASISPRSRFSDWQAY